MAKLICNQCQTPFTAAATPAPGKAPRCPKCGASSKNIPPAKRTGLARRTPAAGSKAPSASRHDQETLEVGMPPAGNTPVREATGGTPVRDTAGGTPPRGSPAAAAPGRLGPYEILEEIGRGGMGLVLKGRDASLRREVAIKILRPESQGDDQRRLRFTEEAQVTGQLEHPGIVPVHYLGQDAEGRAFFSMKLVEGRSLDQLLQRWHAADPETREDYPLPRLVSIFERVVETVGFAHSKGILHRDLKPGNVMVGTYGEVWLMDWGLAKAIQKKDDSGTIKKRKPAIQSVRDDLGKDLTLDGLTVGTPEYMSPEQAAGEALDEGADIFGLGGILYAILTGQAPIRGKSVEDTVSNAAHGKFVPIRRTASGKIAPAALVAIAEKCISRDRRDRYKSARNLLRDLRAFAAGEAVSALPDSALDRLVRYARRHRNGVAVAGVASGVLLLTLTVASMIIAGKERESRNAQDLAQSSKMREQEAEAKRMEAEARQLQAELQQQKLQAASAESAQRRMKAFAPYAQAMDLLMRGQKPERSAELLQQALAIDPEFPEAQFALGEALRFGGSPLEAARAYARADELSRKIAGRPNLQAILAAGFAYDGAGYYKEAEEAFHRAELNGASDPLAMVGKVFRLAHERSLTEARRIAEEALRAAPHLWESHFAVAYVLKEMAEDGIVPRGTVLEVCLPEFRKALELSPRQAETCVWIGICLSSFAKDHENALAMFDRAVSLEPGNGNRYLSRAQARGRLGDLKGAQDDLDAARRLKASPTLLRMQEVHEASARGAIADAYAMLGEIIRTNYEWAPLVTNYLFMGHSLKKDDENRELIERWTKDHPNYVYTYVLSAAFALDKRDPASAQKSIEAGYKLAPYNTQLRKVKCELLYQQRRLAEMLVLCDEGLKDSPGDFNLAFGRVRALAGMKRLDDALAWLEELQKTFPQYKDQLDAARGQLEALRSGKP
ncbi:MAG: protein kinase [Planctomycetota bacterium]|nr:protein kinase [Planctomycetota bacterium]